VLKRPLGQLLVGLNNNFNKLKQHSRRVGGIASRLLSRLVQKRELLCRFRVVERL
jgi:hypothetical protein